LRSASHVPDDDSPQVLERKATFLYPGDYTTPLARALATYDESTATIWFFYRVGFCSAQSVGRFLYKGISCSKSGTFFILLLPSASLSCRIAPKSFAIKKL
jgi:hypothetical protein